MPISQHLERSPQYRNIEGSIGTGSGKQIVSWTLWSKKVQEPDRPLSRRKKIFFRRDSSKPGLALIVGAASIRTIRPACSIKLFQISTPIHLAARLSAYFSACRSRNTAEFYEHNSFESNSFLLSYGAANCALEPGQLFWRCELTSNFLD